MNKQNTKMLAKMIGVINATHYTRGMQFLKKKWKKLMLISVKVGEHGSKTNSDKAGEEKSET